VTPVPADAPKPPDRHPKLGKPSAVWTYRDEDGAVSGYACRYDSKGEKQFRPLVLYRSADGTLAWRYEAWPVPRPLYGLDHLAARPQAPVLICEGEKAADAAQRLLPGFVCITSPNGAKSTAKADWTPLRGRVVVIWPDDDEAGDGYAKTVAKLVLEAGALSVAIVSPKATAREGA
jgi:hypothetical protein